MIEGTEPSNPYSYAAKHEQSKGLVLRVFTISSRLGRQARRFRHSPPTVISTAPPHLLDAYLPRSGPDRRAGGSQAMCVVGLGFVEGSLVKAWLALSPCVCWVVKGCWEPVDAAVGVF